jgi:hypothetical protein
MVALSIPVFSATVELEMVSITGLDTRVAGMVGGRGDCSFFSDPITFVVCTIIVEHGYSEHPGVLRNRRVGNSGNRRK